MARKNIFKDVWIIYPFSAEDKSFIAHNTKNIKQKLENKHKNKQKLMAADCDSFLNNK